LGISAVADLLTTIEDRQDDPVLNFYSKEVLTILATRGDDEHLQSIQNIYRDRLADRDQWIRENRLWKQLRKLYTTKEYEKGITILKRELSNDLDDDRELAVQITLIRFWVAAKKCDDALDRIELLLASSKTDDRNKRRLRKRKVRLLYYSENRKEQTFPALEAWIAKAERGSPSWLDALKLKADLLDNEELGSAKSIEAWRVFRDATQPDTFDWLSGTVSIARGEKAAGNPARAAKLWDQVISVLERQRDGELDISWPWTWDGAVSGMMQAAEVHSLAGNRAAALKLLERAEREIELKSKSTRPGAKRDVERLRESMLYYRGKIEKQKSGK
jgi:hypothetical protein